MPTPGMAAMRAMAAALRPVEGFRVSLGVECEESGGICADLVTPNGDDDDGT